MSIKQQLTEAQQLIKAKEYQKARKLLLLIDHPTAREWLAKLDKIAPEAQSPSSFIAENSPVPEWRKSFDPFASRQTKVTDLIMEDPPGQKPWNPLITLVMIFPSLLYFIGREVVRATTIQTSPIRPYHEPDRFVIGVWVILIFTLFPLAINWRWLGKPRWLTYTLMAWAGFTFGFPLMGFIYANVYGRNNPALYLIVTTIIGGLTGIVIALPIVIARLQLGAHNKWNAKNFRPVRLHKYRWDVAWTLLLSAGIVGIGLNVVLYFANPPYRTVQTDEMTITYPTNWYSHNCGCLMSLSHPDSGGNAHIHLNRISPEGAVTPAEVEEASWERLSQSKRDIKLMHYEDFTLDGVPARYRDTIDLDSGCEDIRREVYIIYKDWLYEFDLRTCSRYWDYYAPRFMAMINTLDFH